MEIFCEEVEPGTTAILTPGLKQKVVHLVRHGQGTHNGKAKIDKHSLQLHNLISQNTHQLPMTNSPVFGMMKLKQEGQPCPCIRGDEPNCPYKNAEHIDARLTQRGRLQATAAGPRLLATNPIPQVIFVSPLTRTLETCTIALSKIPSFKVPIIAEERIRERMGGHICDRRSPVEEVEPRFSHVDFSRISKGQDTLFDDTLESPEAVSERGFAFFQSLAELPESSIAIVTHSSFLFNTISRKFKYTDQKGKFYHLLSLFSYHYYVQISNLTLISFFYLYTVARRFETGEGRVLILTYKE